MSGERLFLDANFVAGYLNSRDQHHTSAKNLMPRIKGATEVLVTEAILIEVGNLLHSTHREQAAQFIASCYTTDNITVIPVDTVLLLRALDFYRERSDKHWGLTDCISFIVMRDRKILAAATADSDFQQAGFRALMLE